MMDKICDDEEDDDKARKIRRESMMLIVTDELIKKLASYEHSIEHSETQVVHAHWIPCEDETGEGSNTYKCSACGEIQMIIDGTPKENGWAYCPNCGAKMDEEENET